MDDVTCLHGKWVDGICKCDRGYISEFREDQLYPIYCAKKSDVFIVDLGRGFEPKELLHYTAMSLTVALASGSLLMLLFFLYTMLSAWSLHRRIKKAKKKLADFEKKTFRRRSTEVLNAELWYPDLNEFWCVNDPNFTIEKVNREKEEKRKKKLLHAKVMYSYHPKDSSELRLRVGDTIIGVIRLNQGWCKGNLNGKFGFFPEAYAELFEPGKIEATDELLVERDESKEREKKKPHTKEKHEEEGSKMKGGERVSNIMKDYPTKFEKTDKEKEKSPKKRMPQHIAGEKTEASTVMEQQSSPKVEKKEKKSSMKVPQHIEGGASKILMNKTSDKQREKDNEEELRKKGQYEVSLKGPPGKASMSGTSDLKAGATKKGKASMSGTSDLKTGATKKGKPSMSGASDLKAGDTKKGKASMSGTIDSKAPPSSFRKATTSHTTLKGPPSSVEKTTISGGTSDSKAEIHGAKKKPDNDNKGKALMSGTTSKGPPPGTSDSKAEMHGAKKKPDNDKKGKASMSGTISDSKAPPSSFGKATTSATTSKGPPSSLGKATTSGGTSDPKAEMHRANKKSDNDKKEKPSMSGTNDSKVTTSGTTSKSPPPPLEKATISGGTSDSKAEIHGAKKKPDDKKVKASTSGTSDSKAGAKRKPDGDDDWFL